MYTDDVEGCKVDVMKDEEEEEVEEEEEDVVKVEEVDEGKITVSEVGSCEVEEVCSDVGLRSTDEDDDEDEDVRGNSGNEVEAIVILGKEDVWIKSVLGGTVDDIDVDDTC